LFSYREIIQQKYYKINIDTETDSFQMLHQKVRDWVASGGEEEQKERGKEKRGTPHRSVRYAMIQLQEEKEWNTEEERIFSNP
jgi:hypothetical protein